MRSSTIVIAFLVVALLCVTIEGRPKNEKKQCPTCPDDYSPVCGMIGGTKEKPKVTKFGNKCVLQKYICEKGSDVPELPSTACGPNTPERLQ